MAEIKEEVVEVRSSELVFDDHLADQQLERILLVYMLKDDAWLLKMSMKLFNVSH